MYIAFEGIDGSGKTTISHRVADALTACGVSIFQTRMKTGFATPLAGELRELARDVRHLSMTARVETLLGAAREAELLDQVVRPRLEAGQTVIADRSLYTTLVQAVWARGLDRPTVEGALALAGGGLEPDLVIYCDVPATTSRLRRRIQKIRDRRTLDAGRKGMSGLVLREKMREGYLALAKEDPARWTVIDNDRSTLEEATAIAIGAVFGKLGLEVPREVTEAAAQSARRPVVPWGGGKLEDLPSWFYGRVRQVAADDPAFAAFLLLGLDAREAHELRMELADVEPAIVAYSVGGLQSENSMRVRYRLANREPEVVAESIGGFDDEISWDLRKQLAARAPDEVAASLRGIDSRAATQMRQALAERAPEGVLRGLGGLDTRFAWELREVLGRAYPLSLAKSLRGLDGERAWELRGVLLPTAPAAVLGSIGGLDSERAWQLRRHFVGKAPKLVLRTIDGMSGDESWAIRKEASALGKELLDSVRGLDEERAWALREQHRAAWPHTAVGSVGALAFTPRGEAFVRRELETHPSDLMVARKAVVVLERVAERVARWGATG
jgi:dTMP kinase